MLSPRRAIWQFDIPDAVCKEEKVRPASLVKQYITGASFDITRKRHLLCSYLVQDAQFYGGAYLRYQFLVGSWIDADIGNNLKEPGPFRGVPLPIFSRIYVAFYTTHTFCRQHDGVTLHNARKQCTGNSIVIVQPEMLISRVQDAPQGSHATGAHKTERDDQTGG